MYVRQREKKSEGANERGSKCGYVGMQQVGEVAGLTVKKFLTLKQHMDYKQLSTCHHIKFIY